MFVCADKSPRGTRHLAPDALASPVASTPSLGYRGLIARAAPQSLSLALRMYPVVFFDALRVKIRDEAVVRNKAIYLALGVLPDGTRDILGIWIENTEGAKFWLKVFNALIGATGAHRLATLRGRSPWLFVSGRFAALDYNPNPHSHHHR